MSNENETQTSAEVTSPISDELADAVLAMMEREPGVPCEPDCDFQTHRRAEMRAILGAAYPAIRQQVAEEIAVALESEARSDYDAADDLRWAAMKAREIGAR